MARQVAEPTLDSSRMWACGGGAIDPRSLLLHRNRVKCSIWYWWAASGCSRTVVEVWCASLDRWLLVTVARGANRGFEQREAHRCASHARTAEPASLRQPLRAQADRSQGVQYSVEESMGAPTHLELARANSESRELRDFGNFIKQDPDEEISFRVALRIPSSDLSRVGMELYRFDLEMRRAAAYLSKEGAYIRPSDGSIAPIPITAGGLSVKDVRPGSLEALLVPVGLLVSALASNPATALANALTFFDHAPRMAGYVLSKREAEKDSLGQVLQTAERLLARATPEVSAELPSSRPKRRQAEYRDGTQVVQGSTVIVYTEETATATKKLIIARGEG